jgi:hypothetical protein
VVNGIARWDGASWRALGEGVNGRVEAVAVSESGIVYVGGSFSRLGGSPTIFASNIAAWNGTNWSVLGGRGEFVFRRQRREWSGRRDCHRRRCCVCGRNVHQRPPQHRGIHRRKQARWRRGTWSPVGSGATNGVDAGVSCMKNTADIADVLLFGGRSIVFEFDKPLEL